MNYHVLSHTTTSELGKAQNSNSQPEQRLELLKKLKNPVVFFFFFPNQQEEEATMLGNNNKTKKVISMGLIEGCAS